MNLSNTYIKGRVSAINGLEVPLRHHARLPNETEEDIRLADEDVMLAEMDTRIDLGIEPNPEVVFLSFFGNPDQIVEVILHTDRQEGCSYSRRIELCHKAPGSPQAEMMLTIEEAEYIIEGLMQAIIEATNIDIMRND